MSKIYWRNIVAFGCYKRITTDMAQANETKMNYSAAERGAEENISPKIQRQHATKHRLLPCNCFWKMHLVLRNFSLSFSSIKLVLRKYVLIKLFMCMY